MDYITRPNSRAASHHAAQFQHGRWDAVDAGAKEVRECVSRS